MPLLHPAVILPKIVLFIVFALIFFILYQVLPFNWWLALLVVGLPLYITASLVLAGWLLKRVEKTKMGQKFILPQADKATGTAGPAEGMASLRGKVGITETMLRPAGRVQIDRRRYTAVTEATFLPPGTKIKVTKIQGGKIIVEEVK
jgi:membrane-bound serine protease (ClpP class)